jgi:hypothetical protein
LGLQDNAMKIVKILAILLLSYVGVVVAFESLLGYFQPENEGTLVLSITDGDGATRDRVLARLAVEDDVYVAVNHWPRQWYYQVMDHPNVTMTHDGASINATAIPVTTDEEAERVNTAKPLGLVFRILTGFPPRYFVRLDPD